MLSRLLGSSKRMRNSGVNVIAMVVYYLFSTKLLSFTHNHINMLYFYISYSTKSVYISGIVFYGIGMLVLGLWPTKWGVLVFSTSAGILYGTIFTMPFILVARYHAKNCVSNCGTFNIILLL